MASSTLEEVLPKAGLVYSEKGNISEVLCKPKRMPIKSVTLEKLEEMEKRAADENLGVAPTKREEKTGGISFGGRKEEKVEFSHEILDDNVVIK
eukprot:g3766.t1